MVPQHIAIIMDGNGRWAKSKGKKRTYGHKQGSETLKQICKDAYHLGVKYVTVYAFSTENWKRPKEEVEYLMTLLRQFLKESIKNAKANNMRVRVIGRRDNLADDIIKAIHKMEEATKDYTGLNLQIALNYGGRDEILRGIKRSLIDIVNSDNSKDDLLNEIENLDEKKFSTYLDTKDIPDPELMIRTSGECRTSNYLIWQMAYTEFYFAECHWPEFNKKELEKAIAYYNNRDRRFGGVSDES